MYPPGRERTYVSVALTSLPVPTPRRIWLASRRYWLCQLTGWGGVTLLVLFILLITGQRVPDAAASAQSRHDALFTLLTCVTGLVVSHLLRALILSRGWLLRSMRSILPRVLSVWLIASAFTSALGAFCYATPAPNESLASTVTACLMMNLSLLGAWLALYFLVHSYDALQAANLERVELRAARTENQLLALQAQMNPHFLFNSLNTIRALVPPSNPAAREAVTLLADILRATLREGGESVISLERELAIVRTYLAMEKLRFEDDARIRVHIDPAALSREVPPLILLTLVENAIKHGLAAEADGELTVEAGFASDCLRLSVTSPGGLRTPGDLDAADSLGLGIHNSRERLRLIFGPKATLELTDEPGRVQAVILIPPNRFADS